MTCGYTGVIFYVLTEYLQRNNHQNITEKLNEVYIDEDYHKEFEPIQDIALENLRKLTKDDEW